MPGLSSAGRTSLLREKIGIEVGDVRRSTACHEPRTQHVAISTGFLLGNLVQSGSDGALAKWMDPEFAAIG